MKNELDEHTYLELKYFPQQKWPKQPVFAIENLVLCGSLYDGIEPTTSVKAKEGKRSKWNTKSLS